MFLSELIHDLRYSVRQLRMNPGFAATSILTLALAIGSATAVFCVVYAVVLRPLPYNKPERIFMPATLSAQHYNQPFSWPSFQDARQQVSSTLILAGFNNHGHFNMQTPSGAYSVNTVQATDNFFEVFGVRPLLGRAFVHGDEEPGRNQIIVLSHEVWRTQFGASRDVIGQSVRIDGRAYTIVGVMPAGFRFPLRATAAIYVPMLVDESWVNSRGSHWLGTVSRLRDGVSLPQAKAQLQGVLDNIGRAYPGSEGGRTTQMIRLADQGMQKTRSVMWMLLAAVASLLAIGCCNVAGLLMARGVKREREMALRSAVGAERFRLVRQLVTESLMLAFFGCAIGSLLAQLMLIAMREFLLKALGRGADIEMNWPALGAALLAAVLTSVLASLLPALRLASLAPAITLKSGVATGARRGQSRMRATFIVVQVGLSMVLLVVSGLLMRSVLAQSHAELGLNPEHLYAIKIDLAHGVYENRDPIEAFYHPLFTRVGALPGVKAVGAINVLPIENYGWNSEEHVFGEPPAPKPDAMLAEVRVISAGYFAAMGAQRDAGRDLNPSLERVENSAISMVANNAFERRFLRKGSAVGRQLDADKPEERPQIVGVYRNLRQTFEEPQALPELDYLMEQLPVKERLSAVSNMTVVIRYEGDKAALAAALRDILHDVDPFVPFRELRSMHEVIDDSLVFERMESWIFGIFAALALLLAMLGLYGLISHEVELSTRDIGVRIALGSTRQNVLLHVLRRVCWMLALGVLLGFALTFAAKKAIASLIAFAFVGELPMFFSVAAALIGAGLLAAFLPARRAAAVDPMSALRAE